MLELGPVLAPTLSRARIACTRRNTRRPGHTATDAQSSNPEGRQGRCDQHRTRLHMIDKQVTLYIATLDGLAIPANRFQLEIICG
ncbi:MAG: hypothetical protein ACRD7E_08960, partial [Bryobacteraceae bacterium]